MPTPEQLAIRANDPVLLLHPDEPPGYHRAGRDPYQSPGGGDWLIRLVGVNGEDHSASTVELDRCQPLPPELGDLVALVDSQLIARDTAQGCAPGYVAAGEWTASVHGIGPWTGGQMNALYAAVLRRPRPIADGKPCSGCAFAVRVPGGDPRARATQAPCVGCIEPQNDRWRGGVCWFRSKDGTSLCSGALHQWETRLICGRHALMELAHLDENERGTAEQARRTSRSLWRLEGEGLPPVDRLLRWAHRVVGKPWEPRSSRRRA